mmetsp:Transcript_19969/g.56329  ORF Transcript_19969/g.56329 Transcript_19969/m.56329 type:complete len:781 (-) Transcript_19969:85-2427(-)
MNSRSPLGWRGTVLGSRLAVPGAKAARKLWTPRSSSSAEGKAETERLPEEPEDGQDDDPLDAPLEPVDYELNPSPPRPLGPRRVVSRPASRQISPSSRQMTPSSRPASSAASVSCKEMSVGESPLPMLPWCGRCPALRPYGMLPLKPEEVNQGSHRTSASSVVSSTRDSAELRSPSPPKIREKRTVVFAEHMKQTILNPGWSSRMWAQELDDIQLCKAPPRSRFSRNKNDGPDVPPVLRRLTVFEVGLLERWAINHVKMQCIDVCAREHHSAPLKSAQNSMATKLATMCQLVRRFGQGRLKEDETAFLFDKLQATPFFSDVPTHLLPSVMRMSKVLTSSRQAELFRQGEAANGVYVLVQGEVVLRMEASDHTWDSVKAAPTVLLPGDVLLDERRPFCIKSAEKRLWSRTGLTNGDEDASHVTLLLFVPIRAMEHISKHFREEEVKERNHYATTTFAQSMSLAPKLCARHSQHFKMEVCAKSEILLQSGSRLAPADARLMLLVEGEICLVSPRRLFGRKRAAAKRGRKEEPNQKMGPGGVIGHAALYGSAYPHTAIVASETAKILSLRVAEYLEKFLHRTTVLDPPAASSVSTPNSHEHCADSATEEDDHSGRALLASRHRSCKIELDAKSVVAREWKSLGPKAELPRHRAPPSRPRPPEDAGPLSDLCYPRDCDLFPLVQRSVSTMQRSTEWCSSQLKASTLSSAASSEGTSLFHALDAKIARAAATSEEAEAAHRSHALHGRHVEVVASGRRTFDNEVLLAVGAMGRPAWQVEVVAARP